MSGISVANASRIFSPVTVATVAAITLLLSATLSEPAHAQNRNIPPPGRGWKPTPAEVTLLPQYCWAQFTDLKTPEYRIPPGCGPGMNHYCVGLVEHLRAKMTYGDPRNRLGYLEKARGRTLYTIKAMEKFPNCPIRAEVENTLRIVDAQIRGAGGKTRK